jgi:hypothetical protein
MTTPYIGWWRPSKRHAWERLAEGDDYGRVLNDLLDAVGYRPRGGEMLVTTSDPNGVTTPGSWPRRCF